MDAVPMSPHTSKSEMRFLCFLHPKCPFHHHRLQGNQNTLDLRNLSGMQNYILWCTNTYQYISMNIKGNDRMAGLGWFWPKIFDFTMENILECQFEPFYKDWWYLFANQKKWDHLNRFETFSSHQFADSHPFLIVLCLEYDFDRSFRKGDVDIVSKHSAH